MQKYLAYVQQLASKFSKIMFGKVPREENV